MRGSVGSCSHHGLWPSFQMCMASDPSGTTRLLSVDHCRLTPVDDMVLLSCVVVVGES